MAQELDLELKDIYKLGERLAAKNLAATDWSVLSALVTAFAERVEVRLARAIAKAMAAQAAAEAASAQGTDGVIDVDHCDNSDQAEGEAGEGGTGAGGRSPNPKPRNHGRNGAGAYTAAKHIYHALLAGIIGALCKACKAGPMSAYREKITIRIVGQPLLGAEQHHFEQARCRLCGHIERALSPDEIREGIGSNYVTYHWSACAMLGVMHYVAAMPFKRLETLQSSWGIPLADANQWNIVDQSDGLLAPLFKALEKYAIQNADSLRIDDTGSKVLDLQRQINAEIEALRKEGQSINKVRTGVNATGVYVEAPEGSITLYYTGRHHAGEILGSLLDRRRKATDEPLIKVTDAASKNFSSEGSGDTVDAACNAHALMSFRDIKDKYPEEYAIVGAAYKAIFDYDDQAKASGMTPVQRMVFHRENSLPLMQNILDMCTTNVRDRLVEPNSKLWRPLNFIINQWPRLTKFCQVPGVPLDTNLVEQKLIVPVRYLAASFNYRTTNGAEVGDRFMSLVITACDNDVAPVAYLTHCLENHVDLAKRPDYYLPWAYRDRLDSATADIPDRAPQTS
jgi:hypothetical protein